MDLEYFLADVFTHKPFSGNQLGVFPKADHLKDHQMQTLAKELNFSECTFVQSPQKGGDFKLRIFTPEKELPMAGHPTLGAAAVLRSLGKISKQEFTFEENIGPIKVSFHPDGWISMEQPLPRFGAIFEEPGMISPLVGLTTQDLLPGGEIQMVSCGLPYLIIPVKDQEALNKARVDREVYNSAKSKLNFGELYLWCRGEKSGTYHTRMFAPGVGIEEDAATGSAAGPFVCYLVRNGYGELTDGALEIEIFQGEIMGRPSHLKARTSYGSQGYSQVLVSAKVVILASGFFKGFLFDSPEDTLNP